MSNKDTMRPFGTKSATIEPVKLNLLALMEILHKRSWTLQTDGGSDWEVSVYRFRRKVIGWGSTPHEALQDALNADGTIFLQELEKEAQEFEAKCKREHEENQRDRRKEKQE